MLREKFQGHAWHNYYSILKIICKSEDRKEEDCSKDRAGKRDQLGDCAMKY